MDYSDDSCMDSFTNGQIDRMESSWMIWRKPCPGGCRWNEKCMIPAYVYSGYGLCPTSHCFPNDCVPKGQLWNPLQSIGSMLLPGDAISIGQGITYKGYEFGLSPVDGILTFFEHMDMSIPENTVWTAGSAKKKGKKLQFGLDGVLLVFGEEGALIWEAGNCLMKKNKDADGHVQEDSFVIMTQEGQAKLVKQGTMMWSVDSDGKVFDACDDLKNLISEEMNVRKKVVAYDTYFTYPKSHVENLPKQEVVVVMAWVTSVGELVSGIYIYINLNT